MFTATCTSILNTGLLVEETHKALTDDDERELTAKESFRSEQTGPASSVGRVSAPGNGRSHVRSRGPDIPKSLKMVLAAPCLALRLTG